jgi:hypothetical protein
MIWRTGLRRRPATKSGRRASPALGGRAWEAEMSTHEPASAASVNSVADAAERAHLALRRAVVDVEVSPVRAVGPDTETAVSLLVALEEAPEAELRAAALG